MPPEQVMSKPIDELRDRMDAMESSWREAARLADERVADAVRSAMREAQQEEASRREAEQESWERQFADYKSTMHAMVKELVCKVTDNLRQDLAATERAIEREMLVTATRMTRGAGEMVDRKLLTHAEMTTHQLAIIVEGLETMIDERVGR